MVRILPSSQTNIHFYGLLFWLCTDLFNLKLSIIYFQGHDSIPVHLGYNGLHTSVKKPLRNPIKVVGRPGLAPAAIMLQRTISQPISSSRFPSKVPALMDMDIDMNGQ